MSLAATALLYVLMARAIEAVIIAETGKHVFDVQTGVSAQDLAAQLPNYTARAKLYAWWFYAFDFLFPLAAGVFASSVMAFCLRQIWPVAYGAGRLAPMVVLPYLNTIADWLENTFTVWLLVAYPPVSQKALQALMIARGAKALAGAVIVPALLLAIILGVGLHLRRRLSVLAPSD